MQLRIALQLLCLPCCFSLGVPKVVLIDSDHYYQLKNGDLHRRDGSSSESDDSSQTVDDHPLAIVDSTEIKQTFACPRVKPDLHTGDDLTNLSPEDIDIVAAMGDALASGRGLWPPTDVEFRGAAFPIGGDANIDGLVTIPNILLQFNKNLMGESHGMGSRDKLPDYQMNVAISQSETEDLPEQATELVSRMNSVYGYSLNSKWALITIVTGTEEFCVHCDTPDHSSIRRALGTLRKGIPKALIVLLGPVHVASSHSLNINLLKPRCPCLDTISTEKYQSLVEEWQKVFIDVQDEFNSLNYSSFGVLAIPQLTIHSRDPHSLFVDDKALLNRKGHTYAAKWLWNRLISGPNYNYSDAVFSNDPYHCPSVGCPYIRTVHNLKHCSVQTEVDYQLLHTPTLSPNATTYVPHREQVRQNLIGIIIAVVVLALISVSIFGTIIYCRSLDAVEYTKHDHQSEESFPIPEAKLGG